MRVSVLNDALRSVALPAPQDPAQIWRPPPAPLQPPPNRRCSASPAPVSPGRMRRLGAPSSEGGGGRRGAPAPRGRTDRPRAAAPQEHHERGEAGQAASAHPAELEGDRQVLAGHDEARCALPPPRAGRVGAGGAARAGRAGWGEGGGAEAGLSHQRCVPADKARLSQALCVCQATSASSRSSTTTVRARWWCSFWVSSIGGEPRRGVVGRGAREGSSRRRTADPAARLRRLWLRRAG